MTKSILTLAFIILATIIHGYTADAANVTAAPVPEPATVFLLGAGLLSFAVVSRKQKI